MDYSSEILEDCFNFITPGECALKEAEVVFDIPKRKVYSKRKPIRIRKPGNILFFSNEEEKTSQRVAQFSDFGIPVDSIDIKMIINV
ncbi:hypothetical protein AVEN_47106-1 [Araneus ventricosus]|uniref:Uncharacterized protein n=1 Tax=Araneus ventricosus TaxID=182803 RepID=A0A4Y2LAV2_ARAVE|nr:hypothetical protein AVEN_47106-1 [Araneus ventricosus]